VIATVRYHGLAARSNGGGREGWGRGSKRSAGEERDRVSCREGVGRRGRAKGRIAALSDPGLDDDTEWSHETAAPERNVRVTSIAAQAATESAHG